MIRVNGRYGVEVDENQYTSVRISKIESGDNKGKERVTPIGYFTTLSSALRSVRESMIRENLMREDMSLPQALNRLRDTDDEFRSFVRRECRDD